MDENHGSNTDYEQPADGLQAALSPAATSLACFVASIFGAAAHTILHYGSRAQGRASRQDSAFDYFVVVTGYREAYRAAASFPEACRRPRLAALLARLLPPNSMSVRRNGQFGEQEAKCLIISERDFERECSARARDHFVQARMAQTVRLAWTRDTPSKNAVIATVRSARNRTFDWARVFLPSSFNLPEFCRTLINVSFAHEIRAETAGHGETLFLAQQDLLFAIYGPLLMQITAQGILVREGHAYRQQCPPGRWKRWLIHSYFRLSKLRTTLRLLKHPFLYDNWLDYLTRKIDRSSGQKITLSTREQRHPLIFLWPRVLRYLRSRPQRGH